ARIEPRAQPGARGRRGGPACPSERGQVTGEGEPAARASFDLDLGDLSALEHGAERTAAASRAKARKGQVAREILLGGRAHGVERALDVPAPEVFGRGWGA